MRTKIMEIICCVIAGICLGLLFLGIPIGLLIYSIITSNWAGIFFFGAITITIPLILIIVPSMVKAEWVNNAKMFMTEHPIENEKIEQEIDN